MGQADLHIHSIYSHDGVATVPAILDHVKRNTLLDVIAITDHDAIDGAREAMNLAPAYALEVIPGIEISTAEGHLLALFVTELVPRDMSLIDTVICVSEMGGICIAPHPGGRREGCLDAAALFTALADDEVSDTLIGLETHNASLLNLRDNQRAVGMAQAMRLSPIGSSGAHLLYMIGRGATIFPGASVGALRYALERGLTAAVSAQRPWYYPASYIKQRTVGYFRQTYAASRIRSVPVTLSRFWGVRKRTS
jgi:predicted metal-dependent phosphoesterase TrpH